jgi:quinoprotein glucose dehydrogenase
MPTVVDSDEKSKGAITAPTAIPRVGLTVAQTSNPQGEWRVYGSDKANTKYSPLDQINKENFTNLLIGWRWRSVDQDILNRHPDIRTGPYETTPLMVGGVLYASTSLSQVAAIDAQTGKTLWLYDPKTFEGPTPPNLGFVHRGVAYWARGDDQRILVGTGDAYLIALDATTGQPIPTFGQGGRIDLWSGLRHRGPFRHVYSVTSPPIVCRDVVVVGASIVDFPMHETPPGDIRGFDVTTGKQRWVFRAVPQAGDVGIDSWAEDSWAHNGNTNVWTIMSCDEELGYVYLPFSTPTNDYYGGHRPGDNLFGESLVALNAETGKRVWHAQLVHHGLWDYDLPAAPNLVEITVAGEQRKAVAQVTKQGFSFVFDRVTGEPIWPIDERPVPQSTVPGEKSSRTQPFPSRPAPFERQGLTENDLIDFTPALRQEALAILQGNNYGPLFTPPSEQKPTVVLPGPGGGASWSGAAVDPDTGWLYVPSVTAPYTVALQKPDPARSPARFVGRFQYLLGPKRLFLTKPPYGRMTAIDLTTGDHRWMVPVGDGPRQHPALNDLNLPPLGWPFRIHTLLSKTLLFTGQEGIAKNLRPSRRGFAIEMDLETFQPKLRAFDKISGALVGEIVLPANSSGAPMTYMSGGRQYIVVAVGGANVPAELVALRLP